MCIFPEVAAPYVTTPLFIMNGKYDPALDSISGGENGGNVSNVDRIGAMMVELVTQTVLNRPNNAAFFTSCHEHCGQWAQDQVLGPDDMFGDFNVTIDSTTAVPAVTQWYKGVLDHTATAPLVWEQAATYPCATCCHGGQQ